MSEVENLHVTPVVQINSQTFTNLDTETSDQDGQVKRWNQDATSSKTNSKVHMSSKIIKCIDRDGDGVIDVHYKVDDESNSEQLSNSMMSQGDEGIDFSINLVEKSLNNLSMKRLMGEIKKAEFYEVKMKLINESREKIKNQRDVFVLIFGFLDIQKLHEIQLINNAFYNEIVPHVMQNQKCNSYTLYESNIKKINDLFTDFSETKSNELYKLLKKQDNEQFQPYLWDRVNVNMSSKNIVQFKEESKEQVELSYNLKDKQQLVNYIGQVKIINKKKQKSVPHGFGTYFYKKGVKEESMFLNGQTSYPTRLSCNNSLIKSSYFTYKHTYIEFDFQDNLIVFPTITGYPKTRLVITPHGHRYRGELNKQHMINGKGFFCFKDGGMLKGDFNAMNKTVCGKYKSADGNEWQQFNNYDYTQFF